MTAWRTFKLDVHLRHCTATCSTYGAKVNRLDINVSSNILLKYLREALVRAINATYTTMYIAYAKGEDERGVLEEKAPYGLVDKHARSLLR